jgi:hypothetical protein
MAKRHHHMMKEQSFKDRMHEHKGMEGHYEGHKGRRYQEMKDAGMIHEDHSAIANLPQNVMIKDWEHRGSYMPENLDDTARGIDRQMDEDGSKRSRHERPHKY